MPSRSSPASRSAFPEQAAAWPNGPKDGRPACTWRRWWRRSEAAWPAASAGDDRYFSDYLYHESLARQPEDIQRFLRRTAVLDQLCGPLCDAVLQSSGSAGTCARLEASNLFLVPLDRRREWYRYHALFREFLLGRLRRPEADLTSRKLHLRAADWYESNGSP